MNQDIVSLGEIPKNETLEERKIRNALLRQLLQHASDYELASAASHSLNDLVERELISRLKAGNAIPLYPLFEIVYNMANFGIARKNRLEKVELIRGDIARYAPTAHVGEITALFKRYLNTVLERDTDLLDTTLSWRADCEEIIEQVAFSYPSSYLKEARWRMNAINERAEVIRSQRTIST